jgi:hypothetical protein
LKLEHINESHILLTEALDSLNEAIKSYGNAGNKEKIDTAIWMTAFHLEYLTFLLSLLIADNADDSWKNQGIDDTLDTKTTLFQVKKLLHQALRAASTEDVYRKTWIARSLILSIQKSLEAIRSKRSRL